MNYFTTPKNETLEHVATFSGLESWDRGILEARQWARMLLGQSGALVAREVTGRVPFTTIPRDEVSVDWVDDTHAWNDSWCKKHGVYYVAPIHKRKAAQ